MAKPTTKRATAPPDIRAGRKLLDELMDARRTIRDQRKDIDMLNRQVAGHMRTIRELKARKPKAPAKTKGKANG